MGMKIFIGGVTILAASTVLNVVPAGDLVGAVLMIVGCILYIFDK